MHSIPLRGVITLLALAACTPPRQQFGTTKPSPIPTSCANLINADTSVYDSSAVNELPRTRIVPPMTYPPEAQRAKIHGRVMVTAIISATGTVEPTSVTITQPVHPLLDQEAVRVVSAATLWPGCRNGQPVRVRVGIPVVFARGGVSGPLAALIIGAAVINVGAMVGATGN